MSVSRVGLVAAILAIAAPSVSSIEQFGYMALTGQELASRFDSTGAVRLNDELASTVSIEAPEVSTDPVSRGSTTGGGSRGGGAFNGAPRGGHPTVRAGTMPNARGPVGPNPNGSFLVGLALVFAQVTFGAGSHVTQEEWNSGEPDVIDRGVRWIGSGTKKVVGSVVGSVNDGVLEPIGITGAVRDALAMIEPDEHGVFGVPPTPMEMAMDFSKRSGNTLLDWTGSTAPTKTSPSEGHPFTVGPAIGAGKDADLDTPPLETGVHEIIKNDQWLFGWNLVDHDGPMTLRKLLDEDGDVDAKSVNNGRLRALNSNEDAPGGGASSGGGGGGEVSGQVSDEEQERFYKLLLLTRRYGLEPERKFVWFMLEIPGPRGDALRRMLEEEESPSEYMSAAADPVAEPAKRTIERALDYIVLRDRLLQLDSDIPVEHPEVEWVLDARDRFLEARVRDPLPILHALVQLQSSLNWPYDWDSQFVDRLIESLTYNHTQDPFLDAAIRALAPIDENDFDVTPQEERQENVTLLLLQHYSHHHGLADASSAFMHVEDVEAPIRGMAPLGVSGGEGEIRALEEYLSIELNWAPRAVRLLLTDLRQLRSDWMRETFTVLGIPPGPSEEVMGGMSEQEIEIYFRAIALNHQSPGDREVQAIIRKYRRIFHQALQHGEEPQQGEPLE